jgi:uncharacterized membrane protein
MNPLLLLHVTGGVVAIAAGFVALYAFKGAALHRGSGTIFVYAMLSMSLSGALMAAILSSVSAANILAGLLTAYLVVTGLTTVSPPSARIDRVNRAAMLGVFVLALITVGSAFAMAAAGGRNRGLAIPLLLFGAVALLAGAGDLRTIRAGGVRGSSRLRRHLWRMCVALFIASASFFLGPVRRIPEPLRAPVFRLIPLLVLVTMAFWLWRLRRRSGSPRVAVSRLAETL